MDKLKNYVSSKNLEGKKPSRRQMKRLKANLSKDRNTKPISFNNPRKEDLLSLQEKRVQKDLMNLPKDPGAIGKLGKFLPNWEKFTSDWEIIRTVKGEGLQLLDLPLQDRPQSSKTNQCDLDLLKREVKKLEQQGVVELAEHEDGEFISRVFLVKKKDKEEYRLILDLSQLNEDYVEYKKFKMETLKSITRLITPNCWFYSIDFADAYYSIPIHPKLRKFLRFELDGVLYQYTCMPNGYKDAPRLFTKLLKVPLSKIRRELGATLAAYLDDSLGIERGRLEDLQEIPLKLIDIFQEFGYTINWKKSILNLTHEIEFLGFILNSIKMTISLSDRKERSVRQAIGDLLKQVEPSIREVSKVIGKILATMPANRFARRFTTRAMLLRDQALRDNNEDYDSPMFITEQVRQDLEDQKVALTGISCPIFESTPDVELFSDASKQGWGVFAPFRGDHLHRFGGRWSEEDAEKHINTLETKAVWIGEIYTLDNASNMHVRLRVDNTTAVAAVRKQGDLKNQERNDFARLIWDFARERNIWLSIQHIPGVENVEADEASRYFKDSAEWGISSEIQQFIFNRWGKPEIDLFATSRNFVCEKFGSWGPDPRATVVDSLQENWSKFDSVYLFPPFPILTKVIQKIIMEKARGILIIPNWDSQFWYKHVERIQEDYWDFTCSEETVYLSVDTDTQRQSCPYGHTLRAGFT